MTSYAFVLDANGKQLAPTKEQKAWFLSVRNGIIGKQISNSNTIDERNSRKGNLSG